MPFRFGIAVMTEAPHLFLRCTYEIDGSRVTGMAAEGLLPKWFDKSLTKDAQQEIDEMLLVVRRAVAFAARLAPSTAFDFWRQLYSEQMTWARDNGLPALLAHFGVSLVERTLLEALARSRQTTLAAVLRDNLAGMDLGAIHAGLAGRKPRELLPAHPLPNVIARHTVGLSDPLTVADIPPADRISDGLPQALEECIARYGLRHFKLKLSGNLETDLARLRTIAAVITSARGSDHAFTLDGNEQYKDLAQFRTLWDRIQSDVKLAAFFTNLLFVEQPLHRSVALDPAVARLSGWPDGPPMIIDESDAEIGDLARALDLGYVGTSHKNCKGVMKGAAHRCLINRLNATANSTRYRMSGEDLVNIGPVALLQDLAAQAALGNATVERNGHHYFRGLSMFSPAVNATMLAHHGDLYTHLTTAGGRNGVARLRIESGHIDLASVNRAPFGVGAPVSLETCERIPL